MFQCLRVYGLDIKYEGRTWGENNGSVSMKNMETFFRASTCERDRCGIFLLSFFYPIVYLYLLNANKVSSPYVVVPQIYDRCRI